MADPSLSSNNLSERQLRRAIWLTEHRLLMRRIGVGFLIAIGVVSWLFTFWGVVNHFFIEGAALRRDIAALANPQNARASLIAQLRPQPPQIADVLLVPSGGTSYDAVARVVNPNPKWLLRMGYQIDIPGADPEIAHAVLLPGRERWLTRFNATSAATPSSATLTITDMRWDRIAHTEARDVEQFVRTRFDIDVRDTTFLASSALTFGGSASSTVPVVLPSSISRAVFTIANRSAYHLRNIEFTVLLRRSGAIVGVNRVTIDTLRSGAMRQTAATWFRPVGLVQAVEVYPFVDVFDPESFSEIGN